MIAFFLVLALADVPVPESLVIQGAPAVPAEIAENTDRYRHARAATLLDWHPTRREMLIVTRFGDTAQIHRVAAPGGARTQLTFFRDHVNTGVYEPKTGQSILFNKDRGGDGNSQIYRMDAATGAITLVTDGASLNGPPVWAHGGGRIVHTSTRRNGRDADLYIAEPSRPGSDRLLAQLEGGGWMPLDWSPDDTRILLEQMISATESALWIVDATNGAKTAVPLPKGSWTLGTFSHDGKRILTTSDVFAEVHELISVEIASGKTSRLTKHIAWDVIELALSPDGRLAAIVTNEAGVFALHLIDVVTGRERPTRIPSGYVTSLRWHPNGRELGFGLDSAHAPTDVYSLETATGNITRWTESETGGVDVAAFPDPQVIEWKSFDGRAITGFLYMPPARFEGKRPVLMDIHGGPEGQFTPYFLGSWNYYLNELGVALLFPNIRGSSGFGKTFLKLDDGMRREDALRDIGALFDALPSMPRIDASRVVVSGTSYGGYMTLSVATRYPDRIRGAIDVVGPSNLVSFLERTADYRRDLRRVEYGDERDPATREFLERIAPLRNADRITKPLFVVQGANDPAVATSESEQIVEAVRRNGTPVWYVLAKDEGHGLRKGGNADYQFYLTVLFLKRYLLGDGRN